MKRSACVLWAAGAVAVCGLALLPSPFSAVAAAVAGLLLCGLWWTARPAVQAGMKPTRALLCARGIAVPPGLLTVPDRTVTAAACPLQVEQTLRLRADSGALLMATAVALTLTVEPQRPASEALRPALTALKLNPEALLHQCPCLGDRLVAGVPGHRFRDGRGQRAYAMEESDALVERCGFLWEGGKRPITEEDRARLRVLRNQLGGGDAVVLCVAMAEEDAAEEAVFLGMLCVDAAERPGTREALANLRIAGLTVAVSAQEDVAAHLTRRFALDDMTPHLLTVALSADAGDAGGEIMQVSAEPGWEEAPMRLLQALQRGQAALIRCIGQIVGLTLAALLGGFHGPLLALCWGIGLTLGLSPQGEGELTYHARRAWVFAAACAVVCTLGALLCRSVGGMASDAAGQGCAAAFAALLPLLSAWNGRGMDRPAWLRLGLCALMAAGVIALSFGGALQTAFALITALLGAMALHAIRRHGAGRQTS